MALIDTPVALDHLRLEADYPPAQVTPYLRAAELRACEFLNRKVYKTSDELTTALATVPDALVSARAAYQAAVSAAEAMSDPVAREIFLDNANVTYLKAQADAAETLAGIVLNDDIAVGILLILGHLFENRQDVQAGVSSVQIPMGSQYLLMPYRVGLGV